MMDGLDALSGSMALIAIGWLLTLCLAAPLVGAGKIGALLVLAMATSSLASSWAMPAA